MASGESSSGWGQRFFASTRGRVVALLRGSEQTVDELAQSLDLTDNAVRAHLATLERDGLVRQRGVRRGPGSGKPAYAYGLTPDAESLFPKAYGELLRQLLTVLSDHLSDAQLDGVLHDLACRLAEGRRPDAPLEARVQNAVAFLGEMGGLAISEPASDGYTIKGSSCPLAAILPGNPKACRLAELLLEELTGVPVREHCQKDSPPHCQFEVGAPG